MGGRKGAKKTVGRTRTGEGPKYVMRLYYVRKENGAYAPKYERIPVDEADSAKQ